METFDYIIIGAGSAGCVLANRLSENPSLNILLIEAGGSDKHPYIQAPQGFSRLLTTSASTGVIKRKKVKESGDVKYSSREARSSEVRVPSVDISMCADSRRILTIGELGNLGWSYKEVLPYFIKSEDRSTGKDSYHGVGGRSMSRTCWNAIPYVNCLSREPKTWCEK